MQDVDGDVHRSLLWLLEHDVAEAGEMFFVVDYDHFGDVVAHELIPNGSSILVCYIHIGGPYCV